MQGFFFGAGIKKTMFSAPKKKRAFYDYDALYEFLRGKGEFTPKDIKEFARVEQGAVQGIITTLSLTYPIYEKGFGKYALLKKEDL